MSQNSNSFNLLLKNLSVIFILNPIFFTLLEIFLFSFYLVYFCVIKFNYFVLVLFFSILIATFLHLFLFLLVFVPIFAIFYCSKKMKSLCFCLLSQKKIQNFFPQNQR